MASKLKKNKKQDTKAQSDKRDAAWTRGEKRKAERRKANLARHLANLERLADGQPTPWQIAKAARAERRIPLTLDWLKRNLEKSA